MEQKKKILAVLLLGVALAALYWQAQSNSGKVAETIAEYSIGETKDMFMMHKERDIAFLSFVADEISRDQKSREFYLDGNKENLYAYRLPLFHDLRNNHGIAQFNFILPNGTAFLRMQSKDMYGDTVSRLTFIAAKESNMLAAGIDPGKTGYSLRVIAPYYGNGSLIGYIELGEDMGIFLRALKGRSTDEFTIVADKNYLDKDAWIGLRAASGQRDNWDDLPSHVVVSSTKENAMQSCITESNIVRIKSGEVYLQKLKSSGKTLSCGGFELMDASGKIPIGAVFILSDITEKESAMQKVGYYSGGMFLIALAILIFMLFSTTLPQKNPGGMPSDKEAAPAHDSKNRAVAIQELLRTLEMHAKAITKGRVLITALILLSIAMAIVSYSLLYKNTDTVGGASAASTNGITDSEIVIGSSSALSGHAALLGTRYLHGSLAYIYKINDEGGIYGRKIRVISYDDQYDPPKTVANTQKLIVDDKALLLFDYVGTPTSVKVIDMVDEAKIPLFGLFTGAEELRTPFRSYIFNVRASYYDETGAMVDYFVEKKGFTRIAVFYQDDAFGKTGLKGTEIALERHGLAPVARSVYTRGTTAVEPGLNIIKGSNPEAIVMIGTYTPLAKFIDLYRKEGYDPYFHTVSFVGAEAFAGELSRYGINSSDQIIVTEVVPDPREASAEYLSLNAKYFPEEEATYTGLEGYANAVLLVKALKDAGRDLDRGKFIQAVEAINGYGVVGIPAIFGPGDHRAFDTIYFSHLNDGRFRIFE